MDMKELESLLTKQLEENHILLHQNNFLLQQILGQNKLIFEITQKNIRHFSYYWYWYERDDVKKLREELEALHKNKQSILKT